MSSHTELNLIESLSSSSDALSSSSDALSSSSDAKIKIDGFGILCNHTYNIGDDIQTLACRQQLPQVDYYIVRDNFARVYRAQDWQPVPYAQLKSMKIAVIITGWLMHSQNECRDCKVNLGEFVFPPPDYIIPMYVSIHITPKHNFFLYNARYIRHYKEHEPIGCRDPFTLQQLTQRGVTAYLSGCLTVLLNDSGLQSFGGSPSFEAPAIEKIYVLDCLPPDAPISGPADVPTQTKLIRHVDRQLAKINLKSRFEMASQLLKMYQKAKHVVTDRLHCYLPCTAFETCVQFVGDCDDVRCAGLVDQPRDTLIANASKAKQQIADFVALFSVTDTNHKCII